MRSMTGYGRFSASADNRDLTVELKSVNHRFLDVNMRLPRGLAFLEEPIRGGLAKRLNRGHVDVFAQYRNGRDDAREVQINAGLAGQYRQAFAQLSEAVGIAGELALEKLAAFPDVLTLAEREEDQAAVTALCLDALSGALDALTAMREREGSALAVDIAARLDKLSGIVAQMEARAPLMVRDYRDKLTQRIAELLTGQEPDPQRLAQEVALMADRAAIDEELVRLKSHIGQVRECLVSGEPVGRKLDFLVQELNREYNTIGSKASDLLLTKLVLDAKAEVEKLREQVQNIE